MLESVALENHLNPLISCTAREVYLPRRSHGAWCRRSGTGVCGDGLGLRDIAPPVRSVIHWPLVQASVGLRDIRWSNAFCRTFRWVGSRSDLVR